MMASPASIAPSATSMPTPSPTPMATADQLPTDILQCIQKLLPLDDYLRFPAVCTSWRSAAKQNPHPPSPSTSEFPWLLFLTDFYKTKTVTAVRFLSSNNDRPCKTYRIPIPRHLQHYNCFVSSADHYIMAAETKRSDILLLNPFSSWTPIARLPPTATFYDNDSFRSMVVTDGCSVAICMPRVRYVNMSLAYTRFGSDRWLDLGKEIFAAKTSMNLVGYHFSFQDAVPYNNAGLFFVVAADGSVVSVDFSSSSSQDVVVTDATFNLQNDYITATHGEYLFKMRLVVDSSSSSDHHLFMVASRLLRRGKKKARNVSVYKLLREEKRWVSVKSLGNCSFFLGDKNQSLSLSAEEFPTLRTNHIYFPCDEDEYTFFVPNRDKCERSKERYIMYRRSIGYFNDDNHIDDYEDKDDEYTADFERNLIYNLGDGSWEQFYDWNDEHYEAMSMDMMWVTPRLV